MFNLNNLPTAKIEPFDLELPRALSAEEIADVLNNAVSRASLPDRTNPQNLAFEVPLRDLFVVEPTDGATPGIRCTPVPEAIDDQAVRWCEALTRLPPKSLSRTERPIIKLMKRLPPKPTGNPAFDTGRRIVLNRVLISLWPVLAQTLADEMAIRASN